MGAHREISDGLGVYFRTSGSLIKTTCRFCITSDGEFWVVINREARRVRVSFDASAVDSRHSHWLESVRQHVGLGDLEPQPYWDFDDLFHKAGTKLLNCFYIRAQTKRAQGIEFFWYNKIMILQKLSLEKFLTGLEEGFVLIDFDARTKHNHGTKFRLRQDRLPDLYDIVTVVE